MVQPLITPMVKKMKMTTNLAKRKRNGKVEWGLLNRKSQVLTLSKDPVIISIPVETGAGRDFDIQYQVLFWKL